MALSASPALAASTQVSLSGSTLMVIAAPGAKDNLVVSHPAASKLQVSDFPTGSYTGASVHAGAGCAQSGTRVASCVATGVSLVYVSAGDLGDKVTNSTSVASVLDGGPANDTVIGGRAVDTLIGGRGPDVLRGMSGDDRLLVHDGATDAAIDCGAGTGDQAELDALPLDPNSAVKGCESRARTGAGPYVALGDSLSVGYSASSPAKGYVGLLNSDYEASLGVNQLMDEGQAGASTTTLRDNGQLAAALADINAPSDAKAVTIDIGGFEAFFGGPCPGHWHQPNQCPVRANLAYIFGQLQAALASDPGNEPLVAMAYYNPASGKGGSTEASYDTTLIGTNHQIGCSDTGAKVGLNDVIYQEAGKLGIPVADPYPAFKQHGQAYMSQTDSLHVHPNDAGYAAIAQAFQAAKERCGP
ncbi:MAG TPA: GDSL-type esterase/lipase family protein [Solirubrobacterales bacterium]|jgi:lysophospholipase L1-like esterase